MPAAPRALSVGIDTVVRWSKRGGARRIMDLETFEQSVLEGFRLTEARGLLMRQADVLEGLEEAKAPVASQPRPAAAHRSRRSAKT